MAQECAPFVEYNIMRLKKFVHRSVCEVKSAALLGKAKECAGHRSGGQFVMGMLRDVDMSYAAKGAES